MAERPELTLDEARAIVEPSFGEVRRVTRAEDGYINTTYRVELAGGGAPIALRIYSGGRTALEKELRTLNVVSAVLPSPQVLLTGPGDASSSYAYLVYRWIDGITLNDFRRRESPTALVSLAEPLGRLAARVAKVSLAGLPASPTVTDALARADDQLSGGLARRRLGGGRTDALRRRLEAAKSKLEDVDRARGVVHGDFGGRNIIVARVGDDTWGVVGLIDWESAFTGSRLWDVGSLFRYARRYNAEFRERVELGYRAAGGTLPDNWYHLARLLDSTRLVEMLSEERDLADFFSELRDAVDALVEDVPA